MLNRSVSRYFPWGHTITQTLKSSSSHEGHYPKPLHFAVEDLERRRDKLTARKKCLGGTLANVDDLLMRDQPQAVAIAFGILKAHGQSVLMEMPLTTYFVSENQPP